jgi:hypothetical protein
MPVSTLLAHAAVLTRLVAPYPFSVGETLQYDAKIGMLPIGSATVSVSRLARERGVEAFVFAASGQGRPLGITVGAELTSWVGTGKFNSLRFRRRWVQGSRVDDEQYQIVPDSSRYRKEGVPQDWVAPSNPLDELAFLYYLRTVPLKVGGTYEIPRYFKTGYNPVSVRVLGRESAAVPGRGSLPVLVLQVSSRDLTMGVRLTDDASRLPVQLDLPLPIGSVTLELVDARTSLSR